MSTADLLRELRDDVRTRAVNLAKDLKSSLPMEVVDALASKADEASSVKTLLEDLAYQQVRRELVAFQAPDENDADHAARLQVCDEIIKSLELALQATILTLTMSAARDAEAIAKRALFKVRNVARAAAGSVASAALAQVLKSL